MGLNNKLSLLGQWRTTVGTVKYDGQTQVGTPYKTNIHQQQWLTGLAWHINDGSRLIGAYRRDREIQAKGRVRGLDERYSWCQLGMSLEQQLTQTMQLSLAAHWHLMLSLK